MEVPTSSVPSLEVFLLGRFVVRVAGKDVDLEATPGRKARMLLKLLALQRNHQIIRDQAVDLLWPDLDLKSGANQLYKAIYHLRQVFSSYQSGTDTDAWIDLTEELVRLAPRGEIETDVTRFRKRARRGLSSDSLRDLEGAAASYGGDLLPMDLYKEWTSVPREHLKQLYLDVLLALAERHRLQGNLVGASEYFRQALEKDSLLEKAHRGLMHVYALQGQTDRALRQFRRCVRRLEDELGMSPSEKTRDLIEAASRFIEQVSEEARDLGDLRCVAVCHYALGTMHLWRGNIEDALEALDASRTLHERVGSPAGMAYSQACTAAVHTEEDALQAGWHAAQEGLDHARHAAVRDHCLQRIRGVALWNRLAAGDTRETDHIAGESESFIQEIRPCAWCSLELLPWLILHYLRQGKPAKATPHVETLEELAETTGNPIGRALAWTSRSGLAAARGRRERAEQLRSQAAEFMQNRVIQGPASSLTQFFDHMVSTTAGLS